MLNYEDSQSIKLPYSYHDTDPDNAVDQPVDFSKIYADSEPEEVCHPSSAKKSQPSLTSIDNEENKQPCDELRIYCLEGTPGDISFASSYCDLREVGLVEPSSEAVISEVEPERKECFFPSPPDFSISAADSSKTSNNSNMIADETEKRESNNEGMQSFEDVANTKSSSPLMFSRSSSVGSLNSFEQHSIVDDRSSVSAFSNLASGLISPSEIPDSPCGALSPFITRSKNSEFLFPSSDKPANPVLVDQTICDEVFSDEPFGASDGVKVYNYEDCSSVSNLSALSIQANSLHESISDMQVKNEFVSLTQNLSVTVNCSITNGEADLIEKCNSLKISDESYIPEQNSVATKSSLPSDVKDINQNEKSNSIVPKVLYEDKGTSTSEDFIFHNPSYKLTSFAFKDEDKKVDRFVPVSQNTHSQWYERQYLQQQNESPDYLKDNSDDESEDILEECVLSGMPSKNSSMFNDSKQSLSHSFKTNGSSLKEDVPGCSLSDDDLSGDDDDDDDEGILNECVLLGMPQKSNSVQIEAEKNSVFDVASCNSIVNSKSSISNSPNHQLKLFDDGYQSTILSQEKHMNQELEAKSLSLVVSEVIPNLRSFVKEEEFSTFDLMSHSTEQDEIKDLGKSDDDSDIDESDLLVQQCIQLGRSELKSPKTASETKLCGIPFSNKALGCRDNWPDGVSDGDDDDDDMLNEIIKAGKPNSNSKTNKSPFAGNKPFEKSQHRRKLTAAEDRALYLNKDYFQNIPKEIVRTACTSTFLGLDDSTCVYRTEDTPILSPTASISDLSTLSFTEDKICQESFLNNSRNSDCSSESEDDELLRQCIRQGMPGERIVA